MNSQTRNPYASLNRLFHEPKRLAILSALSATSGGCTFVDLKEQCDMTDGNLSRHLQTLEEAGIVSIVKKFAGSKPRTRAVLTARGREEFFQYLAALEEVLHQANSALASSPRAAKNYLYTSTLKTGVPS